MGFRFNSELNGLSPEMREQVQKLHAETSTAAFRKMEMFQSQRQALREAMHSLFIEKANVLRKWQALESVRQEIFSLQL